MITARSQYDERKALASDISFEGDKGLTKQSDARDCDINLLFKRFERTGQLPDVIARNGSYGDFSEVPDYQEACNIVMRANDQFNMLDAHVRNRFDNDPAKFLAFATDPQNMEEMSKMGLLNEEGKAKLKAERDAKNVAETSKFNAEKAQKDAAYEAALIAKIKAELSK